jgi:hypothetical protein
MQTGGGERRRESWGDFAVALLGVSGRMGSCLTPRWVCWDDWAEGRREGLLWNSLGRRTSLLQLP